MVNKKKTTLYIFGCATLAVAVMLLVYAILVVTGVIHLKENTLVFVADSNEAYFEDIYPDIDNPDKAVTADGWKQISGELQSGHTATGITSGSRILPGVSDNILYITITDENGSDVTDEYDIVCVPGKLTVHGKHVVVSY